MQYFRIVVLAPLFLGLSLHGQSPTVRKADSRGLEALIIGLERKIWEFAQSKNKAATAELLSDDFQDVGAYGIWDKARSLSEIDHAGSVLTGFALDQTRVRRLGPSLALLTYKLDQIGSEDGESLPSPLYVSSLWRLTNGRWLNILVQDTPSASPEQLNPAVASKRASDIPPDSFFIAKEREVWELLKHKDKAAATRLLADDFIGEYDTGFQNKSEWIKQVDGQYSIDNYTIEDVRVLRPSPTTALIMYRSTCKGTGEWTDYCSRTFYIADLWVRRDGQWLDLFSQDTQAAGKSLNGPR